jgi:hypothetical protein
MSREDQHFRLRLPADLREKIEAAAAESRRSLTAEILARLESTFYVPTAPQRTPDVVRDMKMVSDALLQAVTEIQKTGRSLRLSLSAVDDAGNVEPVVPKLPEGIRAKDIQQRLDVEAANRKPEPDSKPTAGKSHGYNAVLAPKRKMDL